MMTAETVISVPEGIAEVVWGWLRDLPARVVHKNGCESREIFLKSVENDRKIVVFDDGKLLGFVTCEDKGSGIFNVHLFCPRKVSTKKLTQAIDAFFDEVRRDVDVKTLLFDVRAMQIRLGQILIENGCVFTGWSYRESGETFRCLVWKKDC